MLESLVSTVRSEPTALVAHHAQALNRVLSEYVEGLNTSSLNVGIWSGDVRLKNLRLKRGALDKLRLPVDVVQGYLGDLTLTIPWKNLRGQPAKVVIDNMFLLAVPAAETAFDAEEDEARQQAAKLDRLKDSELLPSASAAADGDDEKAESFVTSVVNRLVDNVQVRRRWRVTALNDRSPSTMSTSATRTS